MPSKKKDRKPTVVSLDSPLMSRSLTQAEMNVANLKILEMLLSKVTYYTHLPDLSKIKVKYGETKPLKPLYTDEGGKHVGYIQKGPRILSLIVEDYTDDGRLTKAGE